MGFVDAKLYDEDVFYTNMHYTTLYLVGGEIEQFWAEGRDLAHFVSRIDFEDVQTVVHIGHFGGDAETYYPATKLSAVVMPLIDVMDSIKEQQDEQNCRFESAVGLCKPGDVVICRVNLKRSEMRFLDEVFDMRSGYVLDFSNRTFEEFFEDEFGIDIYQEKYQGRGSSKANHVRSFIDAEDGFAVGKVLRKLWDYRTDSIVSADPSRALPEAV